MNRQRVYQSRSQSKSSGIEVSGVLQRRGAVRTASEQKKQSGEETKNHSWSESSLVKNFKPVPLRSRRDPRSGAASPFPLQPKLAIAPVVQKYDHGGEKVDSLGHQTNNTGLPNNLKAGIENLSGLSMSDVTVHYNSSKPAQLQALAYTQGTDIHVGPGQEKHLAHEAWHVVQQKQGRVKPTWQAKGVMMNDDKGLEREADVMSTKAEREGKNNSFSHGFDKPGSRSGQELIAHELTNVVQQWNGEVIQRKPSQNNDPTGQADNTYWNRQDMKIIGSDSVPERITAIMKNPSNGGVPSVSPPGWDWLQKKIGRLKGSWVRFHIINQFLGGPGNATWNLVPTSVAVNNAYSSLIEKYAKNSAITNNQWTYVDVSLTYDSTWPAPIPKSITAEWGKWDASQQTWKKQNSTPSPLLNSDITTLDSGSAHLRGVNITQVQVGKRNVPKKHLSQFTNWLKSYRTGSDKDEDFLNDAEKQFGEDFSTEWLKQVWLDEDDTTPNQYLPVVKAL